VLRIVETGLESGQNLRNHLKDGLADPELRGVIVFATPDFDTHKLASDIANAFSVPTVGGIGQGVIGPSGHRSSGVSAVGFYGSTLRIITGTLDGLSDCGGRALDLGLRIERAFAQLPADYGRVAFVLSDQSRASCDPICGVLHSALRQTLVVGGTLADSESPNVGSVYTNGEFRSDRAVIFAVAGNFCATVLQTQQFSPLPEKVVVTASDPKRHLVFELDGEPAVKRYGELVNVRADELTPEQYVQNPLLLKFAHTELVRVARESTNEGGLRFICALRDGDVLHRVESRDANDLFETALDKVQRSLGEGKLSGIIGFDSAFRCVDHSGHEKRERTAKLYRYANIVGVQSIVEWVNARNMNFSFAGVAFGKR
jgi:hypothetical protein